MPPQLLSLICFGVQQLIIHEPEIAAEIKALFTKEDPTKADWDALHTKIAAKSYADYVQGAAQPVPIVMLSPPAVAPEPTPAPAVVPEPTLPDPSGKAAAAISPATAPTAEVGAASPGSRED